MSLEGLETHLRRHHRGLTVADLEPTSTPGYWQIKTPCGGARGGCPSELHGCLFNEGPTHHTISYRDPIRGERGRFASPYRTWRTTLAKALWRKP
jgi:hypothetical protein